MEICMDPSFYKSPIRPTAIPLLPTGMAVDGAAPLSTQQRTRPFGSVQGPSNSPASAAVPAFAPVGNTKRARKDRGPNWIQQEILALVAAKRQMFIEEKNALDARDLMTPENTKWNRIAEDVMHFGCSPCFRDGNACKTKWNQILPEYKRIADYLGRTGRNMPDYWSLTPAQRKEEGLPKVFPEEVYHAINEWYGSRPQIQPPHIRDILSPNDANYRATTHPDEGAEETSEPDTEDPMDLLGGDAPHAMGDSSPPPSSPTASSTPVRAPVRTPPYAGRAAVPPGIIPHIISSSDTSAYSMRKRPGNIAVRRKNVAGHTVIAEATKAKGEVMAKQMQNIAESSRDLERSKIEVQLKLFTEQMAYQREKDQRLYKHAVAANENARLSVLKQGEIVSCLANLSSVLGKSLHTGSTPMASTMAQHRNMDMKDNTMTDGGNQAQHTGTTAAPTADRGGLPAVHVHDRFQEQELPGEAVLRPA